MPENYDDITAYRIKPVFKCEENYKNKFSQSSCLLTISVGQEVHEGEKFLTTIDLVNRSFNKCTILVDDSLQRHTMGLLTHQSAEELYDQSIHNGDLWLERNKAVYERLTIPYTIIRWDKWLKHKQYNNQHELINNTYEEEQTYQEAFHHAIAEFVDRYERRLTEEQKKFYQRNITEERCLTYLQEECTAICLWVEGEYNFEVYPSKRNAAMTATHERFVKPKHPELLNPVAIKFKNRKQLRPQKFVMQENDELTLS